MSDDHWKLSVERTLGATEERFRGIDERYTRLRVDVKEDFIRLDQTTTAALASVREVILRENAHTRGEMERLDRAQQEGRRRDEEAAKAAKAADDAHHQKVAADLKADLIAARSAAAESEKRTRTVITMIVAVGIIAQWGFENASTILRFIEGMVG